MKRKLLAFIAIAAISSSLWTANVFASHIPENFENKEIPTQLLSSGDPTLGRLIGDISRGNHPQAPYAASKIIVPRPFQSQFPAVPKGNCNTNFTDINGHWAENEIKTLAKDGYISGFSDGTFRPDAPITYAEFAAIVSRFGFQPVRFDNVMQYDLIDVFSSFNRKADYFNALLVADETGLWGNHVKLGYEVGFMSSNRKPDTIYGSLDAEGNANRQYIALFLANLVEYQQNDKSVRLNFTDTAEINVNSDGDIVNAVKRLANNGIISNQGAFRPNDNITQAELATMICKIMDKYHWDTTLVSDNLYGNYRQYFWEQDDKLMDLVNEARISGGVAPVVYNADLQAICEIKMIDKTIYGYDSFGSAHTCSYGTMEEMRKKFGFPYYIGENAAAALATPQYTGQLLAEHAHSVWTNSEGHRKNYMDANHQYGGFALGEGYGYEGLAYGK